LFQAHPTFQVSSDNTTALIPARFIATSADAMDCFQEAESKDNTMIKIVATTEGIPDAAPTGEARLSVWVLRRPLIPEDTPDEATLGLDPTWPMDATTVVIRDTAGNLSPLRSISAKLKLLTGDMPTTPDGTPAFPVTYAPLTQFLDEQPFAGDRTAWDLGYAKIWGWWNEGADLYNEAMAHSIYGVSPTVTEYLNGQLIFSQPQSPPPPAAYNPAPSPIMDLSEVRYATPLGIDPDGFGPRVMSVPPSWKTDPTNIVAVVRRDGLATPLTQPPSRQHYFITAPNPHTDPSDPQYSTGDQRDLYEGSVQ
jgi:hypothetical protein